MKFFAMCFAALTLTAGVWAQGNCPRGNGEQRCQHQGQCRRGQGQGQQQGNPAQCPNPNCPRAQSGAAGSQQTPPAK